MARVELFLYQTVFVGILVRQDRSVYADNGFMLL